MSICDASITIDKFEVSYVGDIDAMGTVVLSAVGRKHVKVGDFIVLLDDLERACRTLRTALEGPRCP